MAPSIKNLVNRFKGSLFVSPDKAAEGHLFPKTDPDIDGEECLHDCETCTIKLPAKFKIDEEDQLYGFVKGWSTHLIVATGKTDWVRDVADEEGSVMEAVGKGAVQPSNGRLMLSASNIPVPTTTTADEPDPQHRPTTVLLLPAFTLIDNVTPALVPDLIKHHIDQAPTNTTPLQPRVLPTLPTTQLQARPCPHNYLILLCSQKTRDARCGQSAPLLRREFERHLRPLGLYRDLLDERPGGVGVYFISHVGGHKYSANVMIYRRAGMPGTNVHVENGVVANGSVNGHANGAAEKRENGDQPAHGSDEDRENGASSPDGQPNGSNGVAGVPAGEAAQCIWLARVRPEDCENIVRYTVLQGKVVKPERQLRGGFDRGKGLVSW